MLYQSLIITCIGLSILATMMRNPKRSTITIVAVGLTFTIFLAMFANASRSVGCSCFCATLAVIAWHSWGRNPRRAVMLMLVSGVLGHVITYVVWVAPAERAYATIREQMNKINPDERLIRPAKPAIAATPRLDELTDLTQFIRVQREGSLRQYYYQQLHEQQVQLFVNAPGFGVLRRIRPQQNFDYYRIDRQPNAQPQYTITSQSRASERGTSHVDKRSLVVGLPQAVRDRIRVSDRLGLDQIANRSPWLSVASIRCPKSA